MIDVYQTLILSDSNCLEICTVICEDVPCVDPAPPPAMIVDGIRKENGTAQISIAK